MGNKLLRGLKPGEWLGSSPNLHPIQSRQAATSGGAPPQLEEDGR